MTSQYFTKGRSKNPTLIFYWHPNGYLTINFFQSFHMKVNRCRHLFSIGGQLLTFIRKSYEGKKSNFDRMVFIFVLPIRNKSPFSGKNNNFLQNWKDVVKFIGNMAETQNRDANHLRWRESVGFGIRVSGPEYREMEHRETMWWGCCCKKRENRCVKKVAPFF